MKKIIVVGAGDVGKKALEFFGEEYIECFADNYKKGMSYLNKNVIGVEEIVNRNHKFVILVAMTNYLDGIETQLKNLGITHYFHFPEQMYYANCLSPLNRSHALQHKSLFEIINTNEIKNLVVAGQQELLGRFVAEVLDLPIVDFWEIETVVNKSVLLLFNGRKEEIASYEKKLPNEILKSSYKFICLADYNFNKRHKSLEQFKNCHKGQRCFIIGNGPSLTIEDLQTIHKNKEICFGLNQIHVLYGKTEWRPNYLCVCDYMGIIHYYPEIIKNNDCIKFIADKKDIYRNEQTKNEFLFYENFESKDSHLTPNFSFDITKGIYSGSTVAYIALQICVYMGFSEIYLLGMDCSNWGKHFGEGYLNKDVPYAAPPTQRIFSGYREAENLSRENNFRIFNATRGGALEVFERVDFDQLF